MQVDESWIGEFLFFFFNLILQNELFDYIRKQTNLYAWQNDGIELKVTAKTRFVFILEF